MADSLFLGALVKQRPQVAALDFDRTDATSDAGAEDANLWQWRIWQGQEDELRGARPPGGRSNGCREALYGTGYGNGSLELRRLQKRPPEGAVGPCAAARAAP